MPEGWEQKTLGDLGEYINGRGFKSSEWSDEGRPIIRIQNLTDPDKPFNRISGDVEEKHLVRDGDILLSWSATLEVFRWQGEEAAVNQHIFKVVPAIDGNFLFYLLAQALAQLRANAHGMTMTHITRGRLTATEVLIPPVPEQRRIADLMDSTERVASSATSCSAGAGQLLAAATHKLLVPNGDWSQLPSPWELKSLSDVAEVRSGMAKGRKTRNAGTVTVPFLRAANVQDGFLNLEAIHEIDVTAAEANRFALVPDDVLLIEGGNKEHVGRGWIWEGQASEAIHQNHVFAARVKDQSEVLPRFLAYVITTAPARAHCLARGRQTSNLASINKKQISGLPIPVPPIDEQAAIVTQLDAIRETRDRAEAMAERSRILRSALGTSLLSGDHEIPDSYDRFLEKQEADLEGEKAIAV